METSVNCLFVPMVKLNGEIVKLNGKAKDLGSKPLPHCHKRAHGCRHSDVELQKFGSIKVMKQRAKTKNFTIAKIHEDEMMRLSTLGYSTDEIALIPNLKKRRGKRSLTGRFLSLKPKFKCVTTTSARK